MRFPGKHPQPMNATVPAFLRYAASRLHPLGVRVSADVFGLAATHDLGIGQHPAKVAQDRRRDLPDDLPVALQLGRVQPPRPERGAGRRRSCSRCATSARSSSAARRCSCRGSRTSRSGARTRSPTSPRRSRSARTEQTGGFMLWNAAGLYTAGALRGRAAAAAARRSRRRSSRPAAVSALFVHALGYGEARWRRRERSTCKPRSPGRSPGRSSSGRSGSSPIRSRSTCRSSSPRAAARRSPTSTATPSSTSPAASAA